ncbi:MAG TPA: hypothetical protein VF889_02595, partial [Bacteroidota bacterium]
SIKKLEAEMTAKYGEAQRERLERGMKQAAAFWRQEDGDAAAFEEFVRSSFAATEAERDTLLTRFETLLEQLDGHMMEITRNFKVQADLDLGPVKPYDELFAGYDPSAHVNDDFFSNKLAFVALLNFPLTTLDESNKEGAGWSRRQWAETKIAQRFSKRIPGEVNLAIARATAETERYIASYNIWMHHVVNEKGERLFPTGMRLLSHWNLRDQIKADYESPKGLARQRAIQKVMERIVTQTIPAVVVDNPGIDWNPFTNDVTTTTDLEAGQPLPPAAHHLTNAPEPDTRYRMLLKAFQASKLADPYSPTAPTMIDRRFNEDRQIPEARVREMLVRVCSSPLLPRVARLISERLGRPLEPFDIWYNGFRAKSRYTQEELDAIVAKKYPTAEAYKSDIPNLLQKLGFSRERAEFLAADIAVDPARGSGHAMPSLMRSAQVRLRTRVEKSGMNYKGYNIAVHEMGHNVEEVFSLRMIDHTALAGVPNTAFTEALAFVFQGRDLELLGLASPDPRAEALKTLNDFWGAFEIAGVALVDMDVWHWMYDHPQATPAQLKEATLGIARAIWNRYYAPLFGRKDVELLAIYSHMIDSFLYLPDYPLGHMIAHQIEQKMARAGAIGPEFERMARMGSVTPDLWMQNASGAPVGPDALLQSAEQALGVVSASKSN